MDHAKLQCSFIQLSVLIACGFLVVSWAQPIPETAMEEMPPVPADDIVPEEGQPNQDEFSKQWLAMRQSTWKTHEPRLRKADKAMHATLQSELNDPNSVQWARYLRHQNLVQLSAEPGHSWQSESTGEHHHGMMKETSKHAPAVDAAKAGDSLCDPTVKQHHGYFKVGKKGTTGYDKNYFYWLFEARHKPKDAPLIVWLSGGPGCSSMLALLAENGPCTLKEGGAGTTPNDFSWNRHANVVFIDQPIGTGFSFGPTSDYDKNEAEVSEDLSHFLQELVRMHPEYHKNDLYIFGESYAGHFVPATAHKIFESNKKEEGEYLALRGFGIGNGLTDPEIQYQYYPQMAFQPGGHVRPAVSKQRYEEMKQAVPLCTEAIQRCQKNTAMCGKAMENCNVALIEPVQVTGVNMYDMRSECKHPPLCYDFDDMSVFLNSAGVQKILGVEKHWQTCSTTVNALFQGDWMKNYALEIPALLENGHAGLIYAGDADFICNWRGNEAWTKAMEWHGHKAYLAAENKGWTVDGKEQGKVRHAEGLTFVRIYGAGHMVPMNQPKASVTMLEQFLSHKTLLADSE